MDVDTTNPYSGKAALDQNQLRKFCNKVNIQAHFHTLEEINNNGGGNLGVYGYIFTGNQPTELNHGYHNHWLAFYNDELFDSYGFQKEYKLENFKPFKTIPSQIQAYDTSVCGEYCSGFLLLKEHRPDATGEDFEDAFSIGYDKKKNDEIILKWFEERIGSSNNKEDEEEMFHSD